MYQSISGEILDNLSVWTIFVAQKLELFKDLGAKYRPNNPSTFYDTNNFYDQFFHVSWYMIQLRLVKNLLCYLISSDHPILPIVYCLV